MISPLISRRAAFWLGSLLAIAAAHPAFAQEPVIEAAAVDPSGRVARLSYLEGAVSIAPESAQAGGEGWTDAALNRPLASGDRVWVEGDGRAELQLGGASIHLDHDTDFGFIQLDDEVMHVNLAQGAATIHVRQLAERETIQIETPNASVFLRHPGEYHVQIDTVGERTVVKTRSGEAEVFGAASSHGSYIVRADEQGVFSGLDDLTAQIDALAPRSPFESWANDRAGRAEHSESARYVSDDVVGYQDLDGYGEWMNEPSYGYVWRPLYVAPDWAPYRYGRWARISPWGWTWIDDARWGFAPFHYGSWARVRNRWCWVPGPRHRHPIDRPVFTTRDRDHVLGGRTRLPPLRGTVDSFGDNPKRGGDFRPSSRPRTVARDIKQAEQAPREQTRIGPSRERLEIMHAERQTQGLQRRELRQSPPTRTLQPPPTRTLRAAPTRTLQPPPTRALRTAPAARQSMPRPRSQPRSQPQSQPRSHTASPPAQRSLHSQGNTRSHSSSSGRGPQLRTQKK